MHSRNQTFIRHGQTSSQHDIRVCALCGPRLFMTFGFVPAVPKNHHRRNKKVVTYQIAFANLYKYTYIDIYIISPCEFDSQKGGNKKITTHCQLGAVSGNRIIEQVQHMHKYLLDSGEFMDR